MPGKRPLPSALYGYTKSALLRCAETFKKMQLKRALPHDFCRQDDIVVVTMVRDEALRLEYFFKYYKEIGVDRFIVLDHQSADQSAQLIEAEEAAIRIPVAGNFLFKRAWIQAVLETIGHRRWCLVVDADEFLVWPHIRTLSLRDLTAYMNKNDCDVLPCILLDMYPKGPIGDTHYASGRNPLEFAPFFDRSGATRKRSFGVSPTLTKAPLVRFGRGMRLRQGQHGVYRARSADVTGVLLHFKFLQDFKSKIRSNPLIRTFDSQYGKELSAYREKVESEKNLVLHSDESLFYEGPDQLLNLGLMKDSAELRDLAVARSVHSPS